MILSICSVVQISAEIYKKSVKLYDGFFVGKSVGKHRKIGRF